MKIFDCVSGTYYNQNCSSGTRSRLDDLLRFGWFNLYLNRFSQGILNLVLKIFDCIHGTYYNQNYSFGTRSRSGDLHRIGWFNLYLYRFSLNLVTKIFDCVCGTYYNQSRSCGTERRLGDLLQIGWFNLHLDWLLQWILTLHTEFSYLVCGLQYCCFLFLTLNMGLWKCNM